MDSNSTEDRYRSPKLGKITCKVTQGNHMVNESGLERKLVNIWLFGAGWSMERTLIHLLNKIGQKIDDVRLNSTAHYIL